MTKRAILIAVAVVATACGGGGTSHNAANRSSATAVPSSTPDGSTTAPAAATHAGPSATAPSASSIPTTTAARSPSPGPASAGPTSGGPASVQPGTYSYHQSGTTAVGASSTPVPAEGTLRVDPASGITQVWHRAIDPNQPPSDTTWQFTRDGMFITSQVQRATFGQQTLAFTCTFPTPVPAPPWPPAVGATFHGHGDCGNFTADVSGRVTGTRNVTLDGTNMPVFVIESTITTQGQVQSTTSQTDWFAPSLRLAVHTESHTNGTYGFVTYRSDTISDLVSARPS